MPILRPLRHEKGNRDVQDASLGKGTLMLLFDQSLSVVETLRLCDIVPVASMFPKAVEQRSL